MNLNDQLPNPELRPERRVYTAHKDNGYRHSVCLCTPGEQAAAFCATMRVQGLTTRHYEMADYMQRRAEGRLPGPGRFLEDDVSTMVLP